jgi:N-acetylmuramic acid 6-phosphate etherase
MTDTRSLLARMHGEDLTAVSAVGRALPYLEKAVEAMADRMSKGGRWFTVGAGTSGRIGVLDASELPPTFGVPEKLVTALIAGGPSALLKSAEGAEDDREAGGRDLAAAGMTGRDVVVGLAASGTTPYVLGAVDFARASGALTVGISCAPGAPLLSAAEIAVCVDTGPEVVFGSTRLKAGTAQKLAMNMLSTAVMTRLGLVVDGEMVAMRPTNAKLRARAVRIACRLLGLGHDDARELLESASWELPVALVAGRWGLGAEAARERLARLGGNVAAALDAVPATASGPPS